VLATAAAPAMRLSIDTRKRTPSFSATAWLSCITAAASDRVGSNPQMPASVACVSALTGLKTMLPHSFSQIQSGCLW